MSELTNWLLSSEGIILVIALAIIIETLTLILSNTRYMFGEFGAGEENINRVISESSKACTFAMLSFIIILVLFSVSLITKISSQVSFNNIIVLAFAFILFILSFKVDVFCETRRVCWIIKQRLFNFGLLALVLGSSLVIYNLYIQYIITIVLILFVLFFVYIHIKNFQVDYRYCRRLK